MSFFLAVKRKYDLRIFIRNSAAISLVVLFSLNHLVGQQFEAREVVHEQQECVSKELRNSIEAKLTENLKKLRINDQTNLASSHPLFIWPLRKINANKDYSVYTISNYVDLNPITGSGSFNQYSSSNQDYNCGNHSYDMSSGYNHAGSDIMLYPFDWQKMKAEDVEVIAAASGIIIGKDDGNPSYSCSASTGANWNAVYIRHSDNSVTW